MEDGSGGCGGTIFSIERENWGSKAGLSLLKNIYSYLRTTEQNSGFRAMNFLIDSQ